MNQMPSRQKFADFDELKKSYTELKTKEPGVRARNAAFALGVSEAELLVCNIGETVTRLQEKPFEILQAVFNLGEVMALSRNDACVHERHGVYANPQLHKHGKMEVGLFVNPDIDLRLFMQHWKHSFAVIEQTRTGMRHSLQFFAQDGLALHKIYLTDQSSKECFDQLVLDFTHEDQSQKIEIEPYETKLVTKTDDEVNWQKFRTDWENLKDTHDFYPMLRKYKVAREQAFKHIGEDFAYEVEAGSAKLALELAAKRECDIMVFVGNRGAIQIHTGEVKKLVQHGPWFNVLDPQFNLHLNVEEISHCWVSRKPSVDGIITALEVFDKYGELIVTFFGKRKPGIPELDLWREIVADLPKKGKKHAA